MSRWRELYATSPSGKTLFVCTMCGRVSPVPDSVCATPPSVVAWKPNLPCIVLEEIAKAMADTVEDLPPDEPTKGVSRYELVLTSPLSGRVSWVDTYGVRQFKDVAIKSEKIEDLITSMKAGRNESVSRNEPTKLERKHL